MQTRIAASIKGTTTVFKTADLHQDRVMLWKEGCEIKTMMQTDEWGNEGGSISQKTAVEGHDQQTEDLFAPAAAKFLHATSMKLLQLTQPYNAEAPLSDRNPVRRKRGKPPKQATSEMCKSSLSGKR